MKDEKAFTISNTKFNLNLPDWTVDELNALPKYLHTNEERMAAVIRFSRENFRRKTGGPFAAGIFERDTVKLIVIGANRVVPFDYGKLFSMSVKIILA